MRSRYYNVTIKRFINADTERGNITNGKSLNRYSYVQGNPVSYTDPYGLSPLDNPSAMAHILFGLLGVVPGLVGATADLANAILYFTEGKYTEGVISLIGGIASVFGIPCVDKMIKAGKLGKYAADIARITKLMSNTAGFLINGENTIRQSMDMCHKYFVDKKGVSAETAAELALLAASVLGTYLSAKGIKGAVCEWRIKGDTRADFYVGPNGKALPSQYKEWIGTNRQSELLSQADNSRLKNAIKQLYRGKSFIGDGGTADVIRFEKQTGLMLGKNGGSHIQKGTDMANYIKNKILTQDLSDSDRALATKLLEDLYDALGR